MATGPIKGPLGPIMLILLVGVAVVVFFAMKSPELASMIEVSPERNTPENIQKRTIIGLITGGAVILGVKFLSALRG